MKTVSYTNLRSDERLKQPLVDGRYIVIIHEPVTHTTRGIPMLYPWNAYVYQCQAGLVARVGYSSDPAKVLNQETFTRVYLVGLDTKARSELDAKLAECGITLVERKDDAAAA